MVVHEQGWGSGSGEWDTSRHSEAAVPVMKSRVNLLALGLSGTKTELQRA